MHVLNVFFILYTFSYCSKDLFQQSQEKKIFNFFYQKLLQAESGQKCWVSYNFLYSPNTVLQNILCIWKKNLILSYVFLYLSSSFIFFFWHKLSHFNSCPKKKSLKQSIYIWKMCSNVRKRKLSLFK